MKIWSLPGLQSVTDWEQLRRFVTQAITNFSQALTKGLGFTDNMDCQIITADIVAGVDNPVNHKLGKVPIGYIVIGQYTTGVLITSSTTWTSETIYLRCSVTDRFTFILIGS